jgi:hypothetical protein
MDLDTEPVAQPKLKPRPRPKPMMATSKHKQVENVQVDDEPWAEPEPAPAMSEDDSDVSPPPATPMRKGKGKALVSPPSMVSFYLLMEALHMVDLVATYTSPAFKAASELLPSLAMHGRNIDAPYYSSNCPPQQNTRRFPKVVTQRSQRKQHRLLLPHVYAQYF